MLREKRLANEAQAWQCNLRNISCSSQAFVEGVDLDKLNKDRQESQAEMDHGLEETNKTLDIMREEVIIQSSNTLLFDEAIVSDISSLAGDLKPGEIKVSL